MLKAVKANNRIKGQVKGLGKLTYSEVKFKNAFQQGNRLCACLPQKMHFCSKGHAPTSADVSCNPSQV